ncbi:hypothetical protein HKD37_18G050326 [Glycine soja]
MQSLQGLGLPFIMSMEEFDAQVAWPGDQPSSSGGGGASTAQELVTEEPLAPTTVKEENTLDQTPQPSPAFAPAPEEIQPAAPVAEPEPLIQDSSAAPTLDLNEDQPQEEQDI